MKDSTTVATDIANETLEIATLPEITLRIVQVVQDPRSTAHDLHKIVRNDPALSARVLRVVNSAFYGLPGQIGSIDRAIMLLGLNAVKNIAIAASLSKMFKQPPRSDELTGKDLWTHSVAVGAANKLITSVIGLELPDESFLCGLIHDIGLVAVMQSRGAVIPDLVAQAGAGASFAHAEAQVVGATHPQIGMALAALWKFPRSFQYVAGYHHTPSNLARENRLLAVVTHVADVLCAQKGLGLKLHVDAEEVDPAFLDELGLTNEQIEEVSDKIEEELEVVRTLIE